MSAHSMPAPAHEAWRGDVATLGMWVFLATEAMFFGPLFLGYTHERLQAPAAFAAASQQTHLWLGTINTAVLLTSSFTMALAVRCARLAERRPALRWLAVTAALGVAFLGIKATEYALEWRDGLVPALHFTYAGVQAHGVAVFFYLYFLMTGVHAVHLTIGLGVIGAIALRMRASPRPDAPANAVDLLGLYWHFVDAVWIFLYPMFYLIERYR